MLGRVWRRSVPSRWRRGFFRRKQSQWHRLESPDPEDPSPRSSVYYSPQAPLLGPPVPKRRIGSGIRTVQIGADNGGADEGQRGGDGGVVQKIRAMTGQKRKPAGPATRVVRDRAVVNALGIMTEEAAEKKKVAFASAFPALAPDRAPANLAPVLASTAAAGGAAESAESAEPDRPALPSPFDGPWSLEAPITSTMQDMRFCYMCGGKFGARRRLDAKRERRAFLPCAHVVGHRCIFDWMSTAKASARCPKCSLTIRHACEHLTMPTHASPDDDPLGPFKDKESPILPWDYEFCQTRKGRRLRAAVNSSSRNLIKAEAKMRDEGGHADQVAEGGQGGHGRDRDHDMEDAEATAPLTTVALYEFRKYRMRRTEESFEMAWQKWWTKKWHRFHRGPRKGTTWLGRDAASDGETSSTGANEGQSSSTSVEGSQTSGERAG